MLKAQERTSGVQQEIGATTSVTTTWSRFGSKLIYNNRHRQAKWQQITDVTAKAVGHKHQMPNRVFYNKQSLIYKS